MQRQNALGMKVWLLCLCVFLVNCGGQGFDASDTTPTQGQGETGTPNEAVADLSFCDNVAEVSGGSLCAVQPSKTQAGIKDYAGDVTVPLAGFGYHVVGVPKDMSKIKGVWVHFGGSYGRPYFPGDGSYGTRVWISELLQQNYLVIQVAYDNQQSVNGDICPRGKPGFTEDGCAGNVRREVLEGVNYSNQIAVDAQNGIYNRIDKFASYLLLKGIKLPAYFQPGAVDWSQVRVSGHSQGAGLAYFVAKNVGVQTACFIGGPFDIADAVNPGPSPIADWYTEPGSQTSIGNMGAFVVTSDDNYGPFVAAYGVIGLVKNVNWFEATGSYTNEDGEAIDGHGASIGAPALAPNRAQACF